MLRFSLAAFAVCTVLAAGTGLTSTTPSRAADVGDFALEAMIGQMIMVGFVGTRTRRSLAGEARRPDRRGPCRRGSVPETERGRSRLGRALNAAFLAAGDAKPVLLAIDQEGGIIERLTAEAGFTERPSARDVARTESVA